MKKKYITKLMIAACLSSALSLNSCIEEVFPESSTATIDQIGKSDQAISAMVNSVVAFINAFRSYGPQFYHDFGYSGYNLIRESACEDFFCHEPKFDFFDTYGVCNDLGDADVVNTIWYYNYKFLNNVNNALSALEKADDAPENKYYKGICLSYRAMIYMDLVRMYEYKKTGVEKLDAEAASKNLYGITVPIITAETTEEEGRNNPRAPFYAVYKFILDDLASAEELLSDYQRPTKNLPCTPVVHGLMARMWLEMGSRFELYPEDLNTLNNNTDLNIASKETCFTKAAESHKEKRDDTRYLAGAVPVVDGKVVFSKEFQIPGMSQKQIYDTVMKWMNERLKENNNPDSRVVFSDEAQGTIAGVGEEWITFYSSALSLDRTWVNYQITVTCKLGSCLVELEKIRFTYRETEKYKAEEWITDEYALNKAKTKLVRGLAKWRRKTVDFADDIFMDVAVAFGAPDTRPKSEKKKKEEEAQKPSIVAAAGPLVIGQGGKVTTAEADQSTTPAATLTPATPVGKASADMPGYTEIDLKQIPGDVYALMGNGKLVISIGKDEFNMTNMTANAGGALGYQNGKAVAYCTLSADQPYEAIEKAETYTLKLYAPNQTTPSAVIECKKLPSQTTPQAGQPRTYVGEIVKLLMKK